MSFKFADLFARWCRPAQAVAKDDVAALHQALSRLSRQPAFYQAPYNVPDTLDGRFAWLSLLVGTACLRLSQLPASVTFDGPQLSQALFDLTFNHIERNLREVGVGDLSVPKRMRQMLRNFYNRNTDYAAILLDPQTMDRVAPLTDIVQNSLHNDEMGAQAIANWIVTRWWPALQSFSGGASVAPLIVLLDQLAAEPLTGV